MKKCLFFLIIFHSASVYSNVRLPKIFNDHAVLQRHAAINIWGWADAGEQLTITFNNQKKHCVTNNRGKWSLSFPAMEAGGPFEMVIRGENTITLRDILIGEVWLCSGQSNMAFGVNGVNDAKYEIENSNYPQIRHFKVGGKISGSPEEDVASGEWKACMPETVGQFTAVGYFFAKALHNELHVPVGIINASWGGTYIEAWISQASLTKKSDYKNIPVLSTVQLDQWYKDVEDLYEYYGRKLEISSFTNFSRSDSLWQSVPYNDENWVTVPFPGDFDKTILPRFDGTVWFRSRFNLSSFDKSKGLLLHFGKIDDAAEVFINGSKMELTTELSGKSVCSISADYLKEEQNTIAIKLNDYWESGGFVSDAESYFMESKDGSKRLFSELIWKMNISASRAWIRTPNVHPTVLFNGMINPLIPYSIKGILWYQGENNAEFAFQYRSLLPVLIDDWRGRFNQGALPFYFVQLPNYMKYNQNSRNGGANWAEIRESFAKTLAIPNTGMAVTVDIGDSTDVHPRNKKDVGLRLSLIALNNLYGRSCIYAGPELENVNYSGKKAIVKFRENGSKLVVRDRYGYLKGFEVAGSDQKFYCAKAEINGNSIIIESNFVSAPRAVRYGWSNNPDGNLYNESNLPASPFRTDDWQLTTESIKFDRWIGNKYIIDYPVYEHLR